MLKFYWLHKLGYFGLAVFFIYAAFVQFLSDDNSTTQNNLDRLAVMDLCRDLEQAQQNSNLLAPFLKNLLKDRDLELEQIRDGVYTLHRWTIVSYITGDNDRYHCHLDCDRFKESSSAQWLLSASPPEALSGLYSKEYFPNGSKAPPADLLCSKCCTN